MIEKIKILKRNLKFYFNILLDFKNLNKYIYFSSVFLNKLELILNSNLEYEEKINNIEIIYSDFKLDFEDKDFNSGVILENKFDSRNKKSC